VPGTGTTISALAPPVPGNFSASSSIARCPRSPWRVGSDTSCPVEGIYSHVTPAMEQDIVGRLGDLSIGHVAVTGDNAEIVVIERLPTVATAWTSTSGPCRCCWTCNGYSFGHQLSWHSTS
jgi:hypothetical protein